MRSSSVVSKMSASQRLSFSLAEPCQWILSVIPRRMLSWFRTLHDIPTKSCGNLKVLRRVYGKETLLFFLFSRGFLYCFQHKSLTTSKYRAIGGRPDQLNNSKAALRHVNVDLPLAAARALSQHIAPKAPAGHRFNFVFCSSKSRSTTSLLSLGDPRKPKSEAEKGLCEIADANPETFSAWILRPGGIIIAPDAAPKKRRLVGGRSSAGVDIAQMAKVCVKVAVEGYKDRIIDNDTLLKM
jgi:hypothetical protein